MISQDSKAKAAKWIASEIADYMRRWPPFTGHLLAEIGREPRDGFEPLPPDGEAALKEMKSCLTVAGILDPEFFDAFNPVLVAETQLTIDELILRQSRIRFDETGLGRENAT